MTVSKTKESGEGKVAESERAVFCRQVRKRSCDNKKALALLHTSALTGNVMAVLRQELDSMVRCIFLLSVGNRLYRNQLLADSIHGRPWRTEDGRRRVTDKDMVDLSNKLHGWAQNVYIFGCRFIHLSGFHDYPDRDPFDLLTPLERNDIGQYLSYYHGITVDATTRFMDIEPVLPLVFYKIADNLECYIKDIEADADLRL